LNPFFPIAQALGLQIFAGEELVHDGNIYTEVRGTGLWLVQSPYPMGDYPNAERYYVSDSEGTQVSATHWNAGDAVHDLLRLDPELLSAQASSPFTSL